MTTLATRTSSGTYKPPPPPSFLNFFPEIFPPYFGLVINNLTSTHKIFKHASYLQVHNIHAYHDHSIQGWFKVSYPRRRLLCYLTL